MENLKIDTSKKKKFLMKNKNSEFGMQSSLRTIRKTWCLVDRFCQVGRQQISWLNGLDVFYSCFSNYMAQKITDQRVNKQKNRVGPAEKKTEFFDLRGKNFFNKLIFDQQLAVEIFSTRGKKFCFFRLDQL